MDCEPAHRKSADPPLPPPAGLTLLEVPMPKYEVYQRQEGQRRAGHYALLIDGQDAMVSVDPSQFMEVATRELLKEGGSKDKIASRASELSDKMAHYALERKVEALRRGLVPGGMTAAGDFSQKGAVRGYTQAEANLLTRNADESRAVELYMNRGKLQGLDNAQRKQMLQKPDFDNEKDWLERRAALIKQAEDTLRKWEAEYKKGNPRAEKNIRWATEKLHALKGSGVQAASHGFQYAFTQYWTGAINLVSNDIRAWPLMTNTTVDTLRDAVDTFSDTTVDEFDGANYTAGGMTLANKAVAVDDAVDRAEFTADDNTINSLGAGTRSIQGVAIGKFNTNTAGSLPLHWCEFATPKTPDGSNFTFDYSATDGLLYMAG